MIGSAIRLVLQDLPGILLVLALAIAAGRREPVSIAERFLAWILLLPIGLNGLWVGAFHLLIPSTAALLIGWEVSPFQFEAGVANLAIGVIAYISFWRDLNFKAAAVIAASVFLLGDAVGHVREMLTADNFEPGNAGVPFYMDIVCPVLAIALLLSCPTSPLDLMRGAHRRRSAGGQAAKMKNMSRASRALIAILIVVATIAVAFQVVRALGI